MPARLLAAIDSEQLGDGEVAAVYRRYLHRPRYPFELRRQEIACFLSHRKAWREIVDRGLDAGLVAEDDVDADPVLLGEVIEAVLANMQPADFVRLPVKVREDGPLRFAAGKIEVIEPGLRGLGMQAQIVGREAARRLLAETEQFDRPVDTTIQLPGLTTARVLAVRPAFVAHVDEIGRRQRRAEEKEADRRGSCARGQARRLPAVGQAGPAPLTTARSTNALRTKVLVDRSLSRPTIRHANVTGD